MDDESMAGWDFLCHEKRQCTSTHSVNTHTSFFLLIYNPLIEDSVYI